MAPCSFNDCPGCYFDMESEEDLEDQDCNELAFGATVIIHPGNSSWMCSARASLGKVVGFDFESSKWAVNVINIWGAQTQRICYERRDHLTLIEGMREVLDDTAIRDARPLRMAASEPDEESLRNFHAEYDRVLLRLIEQNKYLLYMKEELPKLKAADSSLSHMEAFLVAPLPHLCPRASRKPIAPPAHLDLTA